MYNSSSNYYIIYGWSRNRIAKEWMVIGDRKMSKYEAAAKVAEWEKAKAKIKAFMDKLACDKLSDIISHNNAENKALNNPMY